MWWKSKASTGVALTIGALSQGLPWCVIPSHSRPSRGRSSNGQRDVKAALLLEIDASNVGVRHAQPDQSGREGMSAGLCKPVTMLLGKNYCVTWLELLAIIFGVHKFLAYLVGAKFTDRTDHSTLHWQLEVKELESQMAL